MTTQAEYWRREACGVLMALRGGLGLVRGFKVFNHFFEQLVKLFLSDIDNRTPVDIGPLPVILRLVHHTLLSSVDAVGKMYCPGAMPVP